MAAILVDTHIFIWARAEPAKLTYGERREFAAASTRYVSAATIWEIAVLLGLGRIVGDPGLIDLPPGCQLLPVQPEHCKALAMLPRYHRDPFDRMLVSQAQVERVPLLTRDAAMVAYREHAAILTPP
ncbi:MAG TPA: type II toxin-antitoxin system VapC family toxin [Stellaceae bacterium]|jgi:PIN domain nuclease of toxin-antitoxin system|nr:type II toxin-antitoxin system VapC family toxin [Stellaceae bacterium]